MSEAEKQREVENAAARIRNQTQLRSEKLKNEAHLAHLDHELKFGKLMLSQVSTLLSDETPFASVGPRKYSNSKSLEAFPDAQAVDWLQYQ